jgi:hypothetical protein
MLMALNNAQLETVRALLGSAQEPIRRMHRYDEQRHRVETRSRTGLLGDDRKTVFYNQNGDPVEELFEHVEREYGIDDEGKLSDAPTNERASRSEARFQYDYDGHSNWVTKSVESRSGSAQDFTMCNLERRVIGYFE